MRVLGRYVRFSVDPFLSKEAVGFNSFASKPTGEGLSIFLELGVEVAGEVERSTGFVINVSEIDRVVRQFAVPVFTVRIRDAFRHNRHIGFSDVEGVLKSVTETLSDKFGSCQMRRLNLKLNPFRKITMDVKELNTVYFSEKFEFAAMHKLWNEDFAPQRNFELFGKCANPSGHGHNYIVEVTIKKPAGQTGFNVVEFEKIVESELIQSVDHKNLNEDVGEFRKTNPTIENIAVFAWNKLVGKLEPATVRLSPPKSGVLHCITVWESQRTYCSYYG
jgi:6-pyruvoyltetrahydropterin/6-carboxytetrahydropterin synthase